MKRVKCIDRFGNEIWLSRDRVQAFHILGPCRMCGQTDITVLTIDHKVSTGLAANSGVIKKIRTGVVGQNARSYSGGFFNVNQVLRLGDGAHEFFQSLCGCCHITKSRINGDFIPGRSASEDVEHLDDSPQLPLFQEEDT